MSVVHLVCPFPPCTAEWWVGREPGQTRFPVPFHMPQGFEGAERYELRCPGAVHTLRGEGDEPRELDAPSNEAMNRAYEHHLVQLAIEHERAEREREAERGKQAPHLGYPVGRPVDYARSTDMYFPGRPADAPEPGPGEAPTAPVDFGNVAGHHLGRAAMDNAHDTTKGLVILARAKMQEAVGKLAGCAAALNGATGIAVMAEIEATAGNALVIAAVGTGAGKPAPAEQMAEQMALAVDTIMGPDGGNVFNAIEVAKIRVETASQQLTAAIEQANRYVALLS